MSRLTMQLESEEPHTSPQYTYVVIDRLTLSTQASSTTTVNITGGSRLHQIHGVPVLIMVDHLVPRTEWMTLDLRLLWRHVTWGITIKMKKWSSVVWMIEFVLNYGFVSWCHEQGCMDSIVAVESVADPLLVKLMCCWLRTLVLCYRHSWNHSG